MPKKNKKKYVKFMFNIVMERKERCLISELGEY